MVSLFALLVVAPVVISTAVVLPVAVVEGVRDVVREVKERCQEKK